MKPDPRDYGPPRADELIAALPAAIVLSLIGWGLLVLLWVVLS